jgi:membrane protein DedA with SNARE-associated domain
MPALTMSGGQQPALPGFLNSLAGPLGHYGLWAIALLVLVEDFGIPVPGETVLIAGAVYAGSGRLNVLAVALVGFAAAVVGDNIGYAIGRFGGRALVERWGRYVFITPERLDKAEVFFNKHGGKIITIARFVEGLRQANGLIAGITGMHWLKFVAYNALGAALWVSTWVTVGYFAGQHITTIYNDITRYSLYAAIAAVVLIAAWVLMRVRRHRRSKAAMLARTDATETDPGEIDADAGETETAPAGAGTDRDEPTAGGATADGATMDGATTDGATAGGARATADGATADAARPTPATERTPANGAGRYQGVSADGPGKADEAPDPDEAADAEGPRDARGLREAPEGARARRGRRAG